MVRSPTSFRVRILAACLVVWAAGGVVCAQSQAVPTETSANRGTDERPPPPALPDEIADAVTPPTAAEIQDWIAGLDDVSFDVRERSQANLSRAGATAVRALELAADGGSLELTSRAIRALGMIGQTADIAAFEQVQDSLEKLKGSKNRAVGRRADQALGRLGEARTRHAIAKFEALGGRMKRSRPSPLAQGNIPELQRPQAVLNRNWKGTDDDLVLLTRIAGVDTLYVTKSAPVSAEALEKLRKAMPPSPQFNIQPRGDAMVGITALSQEDGCIVNTIEKGSPAEKAGLQPGDVILKYNGTKLETFDKLVEITRELQPGTRVSLDVVRNEILSTVEVELADFE